MQTDADRGRSYRNRFFSDEGDPSWFYFGLVQNLSTVSAGQGHYSKTTSGYESESYPRRSSSNQISSWFFSSHQQPFGEAMSSFLNNRVSDRRSIWSCLRFTRTAHLCWHLLLVSNFIYDLGVDVCVRGALVCVRAIEFALCVRVCLCARVRACM